MDNFTSNITKIRAGPKVVGIVRGDVFYKSVIGSRHFLRYPPSIAFNLSSLQSAERAGAIFVEVTDKESGLIYRAPIEDIKQSGFVVDYGYGEQIAYMLNCWNTKRALPRQ